MDAEIGVEARLFDQIMSISDRQFEQFCKIILSELESVEEVELTPKSGDKGIDVTGRIGQELYDVTMGIQAKQYTSSISGEAIRTFRGSLDSQGHRWGVFITTSEFSESAVKRAEEFEITLIDRERLLEILIQNEVGVSEQDSTYTLDREFWEIFDLTTDSGEVIPSEEVPQANDLDTLLVVIEAIRRGYRYKLDIAEYMNRETSETWDTRQADYYALAGWALGYIHKDVIGEYDGQQMRKWGLTRSGERLSELVRQKGVTTVTEDQEVGQNVASHLREMEVVRRVLVKLEEAGEVDHSELVTLVAKETTLNEETAHRRFSTLANWMEDLLPEVVRRHTRSKTYWEYIEKPITDY